MPGHELIAVVVKIEIEWVLGIHIDQNHVGIGHRELTEAQLGSTIRHVVSTECERQFCLGFVPEDLNDLIAFNANSRNAALNMRWWEDLLRIED